MKTVRNMKLANFKQLTEEISSDQEIKVNNSALIVGSIFTILSGLVLYADKVVVLTGFEFSNNFGFNNTETFIWMISQTLSPLLLLIGIFIGSYRYTVIVPIYAYLLQLIFISNPKYLDNDVVLGHIFIALAAVSLFVLIYYFRKFLLAIKSKQEKIIEMYEILTDKK